jgi:TetR/AcrR family transcriptional repressor of nem operon
MRYPAGETAEKHQRILDEASILFRERGFGGVSVSEIMQATGMTHGAFYHHFESKNALIEECLNQTSAKALAAMAIAEQSVETMAEHIQDYVSEWHRDSPGTGCLIAALGAEAARERFVQPVFTRHVEGVLSSLMAPHANPENPDIRRDAIRALSGMVGALMLARAVDNSGLSEEILREVRSAYE